MRGRRIKKTKEQREEQFRKDCIRSGFTGLEIIQILTNWYRYDLVKINCGTVQFTIEKDKEEVTAK